LLLLSVVVILLLLQCGDVDCLMSDCRCACGDNELHAITAASGAVLLPVNGDSTWQFTWTRCRVILIVAFENVVGAYDGVTDLLALEYGTGDDEYESGQPRPEQERVYEEYDDGKPDERESAKEQQRVSVDGALRPLECVIDSLYRMRPFRGRYERRKLSQMIIDGELVGGSEPRLRRGRTMNNHFVCGARRRHDAGDDRLIHRWRRLHW